MPMIKKERFTFWIPAFDLVSEVNACVEKVLDRNIHDVLIQSPQLKEGEMSFLLFWVRLRFGLKQSTRDLHIRTPVILKKGGESSYGAKIPLQADNAGF